MDYIDIYMKSNHGLFNSQRVDTKLVGGFNPFEKIVKLDHFPR